jgi:redox-sensitive bicupin YhaK (pirin superfamily)
MESKAIRSIEPLGFPWATKDPFIFCAYHRDEYPNGNENMGPAADLKGRNIGQDFTIKDGWRMYHGSAVPGFPYHPHRGFETITINHEGFVDHTDSLGAAGRFGAGDVQWMTAGKGVQHSEMFPLIEKDKENTLEIFQIWLNLPRKSKLVDPHFKMLWKEEIPVLREEDTSNRWTKVDVIAGELKGVQALPPTPDSWAATKENKVGVWTIKMDSKAQWTLPSTEKGVNRSIYFYKGSKLNINGTEINAESIIHVNPESEIHFENGDSEAYLLILQGKPLNEPVAQYGPFVMNTSAEIQEAFDEYRRTQFGGWPWPETEQTHSRDKGRFALYADGTVEVPG